MRERCGRRGGGGMSNPSRQERNLRGAFGLSTKASKNAQRTLRGAVDTRSEGSPVRPIGNKRRPTRGYGSLRTLIYTPPRPPAVAGCRTIRGLRDDRQSYVKIESVFTTQTLRGQQRCDQQRQWNVSGRRRYSYACSVCMLRRTTRCTTVHQSGIVSNGACVARTRHLDSPHAIRRSRVAKPRRAPATNSTSP